MPRDSAFETGFERVGNKINKCELRALYMEGTPADRATRLTELH